MGDKARCQMACKTTVFVYRLVWLSLFKQKRKSNKKCSIMMLIRWLRRSSLWEHVPLLGESGQVGTRWCHLLINKRFSYSSSHLMLQMLVLQLWICLWLTIHLTKQMCCSTVTPTLAWRASHINLQEPVSPIVEVSVLTLIWSEKTRVFYVAIQTSMKNRLPQR